jgi:hypothetical protein
LTHSRTLHTQRRRKSFVVYAASPREKAQWIQVMNKFIALARESVGLDPHTREVEARALWVPDSKVNQCMSMGCNQKFTLVQRKHHCRNCGKIVCGPCSATKAILNQSKPERVCKSCHTKLGGVTPTDVPVLGTTTQPSTLLQPASLCVPIANCQFSVRQLTSFAQTCR